jgi:hypothetical protein
MGLSPLDLEIWSKDCYKVKNTQGPPYTGLLMNRLEITSEDIFSGILILALTISIGLQGIFIGTLGFIFSVLLIVLCVGYLKDKMEKSNKKTSQEEETTDDKA